MKEYLSQKLKEIRRELETIDVENCDIFFKNGALNIHMRYAHGEITGKN